LTKQGSRSASAAGVPKPNALKIKDNTALAEQVLYILVDIRYFFPAKFNKVI